MLLIPCPWCGERAEIEFTYGGDATVRPVDTCVIASDEDWYETTYLRGNPMGPHREYWHHSLGCRQWFTVERDTLTHEIALNRHLAGFAASGGVDE